MALMISRMEVESPPGVSISRITNGLPRCCATSSPCSMYCAVAGPIAPSTSSPSAGARDAGTGVLPTLAMAITAPSVARTPKAPVSGARIDVGLLIWQLPLLPADTPRITWQAGVLRPEGAVPPASSGGRPAGPSRGGFTGTRRLIRGYQLLLAVADEVGAAHAPQRFPQHGPVVGIVIAQERLVEAPYLQAPRHPHLAAGAAQALQRILPRVIHGRRRRHRRGQEGLHLVGTEAVLLQPQGELEHVLVARTRMGRDEVRDEVLLLAGLARVAVEQLLEAVVGADPRLHHHRQRPVRNRLRGDLQIAAGVVLGQLLHILRRLDSQVITHAGGDEDFADAGQPADLAVEIDQRRVIGVEVGTDPRKDAGRPAAGALDLAAAAGKPVHVGRRTAEVGDDAGEARYLVADRLHLTDDGALRAALDDAPLVLGDGAEGTAAEAAALDRDREADHLVGGNVDLPVNRVRPAAIGALVDPIHLRRSQRDGRRVQPDIDVTVTLRQRAGVAGIRLEMQDAVGGCIQHRVRGHLLVGRHADDAAPAISVLDATHEAHDFLRARSDGFRLRIAGRGTL